MAITKVPETPEEWSNLDAHQLVAIAQGWPNLSNVVHAESNRRLTDALLAFKTSADRASFWLILFTVALVLLTLVLVVDAFV
jgi:hypothetical protein